ncbi:MAG: hypothetical protein RJA70_3517 [Pseudomonadota bacterium]|jgi:hypothetical protein
MAACAGADEPALPGNTLKDESASQDSAGAPVQLPEATGTELFSVTRDNGAVLRFGKSADGSPLMAMTAPAGVDVSAEMDAISQTRPSLVLAGLDIPVPRELLDYEGRVDWTGIQYSPDYSPTKEVHEHSLPGSRLQTHGNSWWVQNHCGAVAQMTNILCITYTQADSLRSGAFYKTVRFPAHPTYLTKAYNDHMGTIFWAPAGLFLGPNIWGWQWRNNNAFETTLMGWDGVKAVNLVNSQVVRHSVYKSN